MVYMGNVIKFVLGSYLNLVNALFSKMGGKHAFYIFCIPFKGKLRKEHLEFLQTGEDKKFKIQGREIHTYTWGKGPEKILFVHGWQSHSYRWKDYIDLFDKNKYTLVCFDGPGHGQSSGLICNVPLMERTIHALDEEMGPFDTIISHSIGSFSTAYHLSKNQHQVKKYISLAPPGAANDFVKVFKEELKLSNKVIDNVSAHFKVYDGNPVSYYALENFAKGIEVRSLLIHDENDEDTSVENSKRFHDVLAQSELHITKGLGHKLRNVDLIHKMIAFCEDTKVTS